MSATPFAELVPYMTDEELRDYDEIQSAETPLTLAQFFVRARPDLDYPNHLFAPGVDKNGQPGRSLGMTLEATVYEPQRASFSTPPQFGKSVLVLCALVWYAMRKPGSVSAYVSYGDEIVNAQSDNARRMAENAGFVVRGTKAHLDFANGSKILFTSIGGTLEGQPVTGVAVLDDPYKNRMEAESGVERAKKLTWFRSTFIGRTHPSSSLILIGHRWTADDMHATVEDDGFPWTNYPALRPDGTSLWERFKSAVWLLAQKLLVGPIIWESEYQGNPMARGGRLFEGVFWYSAGPGNTLSYTTKGAKPGETIRVDVPRHHLKIGIGVDLAYTEKTSSDWSIAVVLGEYDAHWFVLEVVRRQVKADAFADELKALQARYPGARMRWDGSTTERGAADIMRRFVRIDLQGVLAVGKPYDRAQLGSAAWRRGAVLLPSAASFPQAHQVWVPEFTRVLTTFAGGDGAEDDDVAAFASAYDLLPARPMAPTVAVGSPEWIMQEREKTRAMLTRQVQDRLRLKARSERRGR